MLAENILTETHTLLVPLRTLRRLCPPPLFAPTRTLNDESN